MDSHLLFMMILSVWPEQPFFTLYFVTALVANLLILSFAWNARIWILVVGVVLQVPFDIQKALRILARAKGFNPEPVSSGLALLNRVTMFISLIFFTVGVLQLLYRYGRLRAQLVGEVKNIGERRAQQDAPADSPSGL